MANETRAAELQAPALGRLSTTHEAETAEHLMKQTTISIYLNTPDKSSEVLAHPNHSTKCLVVWGSSGRDPMSASQGWQCLKQLLGFTAAIACCWTPAVCSSSPNCFPHSGSINCPFRVNANCVSCKLGASISIKVEIRKAMLPTSSDNSIVPWFKARFCTALEFQKEESHKFGRVRFRWQIENIPTAFTALC